MIVQPMLGSVPVSGGELHLGSTITASALSVFVLQWLKNQRWFPLLKTEGTAKLNRIAAIVTSIVSGLGVTWVYTTLPNGTHTFTANLPTYSAMLTLAWAAVKQFAVQEWIYQSSANKTKPSVT